MATKQTHLSLLTALAFPLLSVIGRAGDVPAPSFRAHSSEAQVTFFVTDQNDRLVNPITPEDFSVVDGETVVRSFRSFAHSDREIDVIVLVDASQSVSSEFEEIKGRVLQFTSVRGAIPENQLSIMTFGGTVPILRCSRNCASSASQGSLEGLVPAGSTPLYDALVEAAGLFVTRQIQEAHPIVILFSDGHDTISRASREGALTALLSVGAMLYSVNVADDLDREGRNTLKYMADATGGRFYDLRNREADPLLDAVTDARSTYSVTYQIPDRTIGLHTVRVFPRHNLNLTFHSRRGYFYEEKH